jgi:histidyl-tRNA synthetase
LISPRAPKGTYDLLPVEAARRDRIVAVAAEVFTAHGYGRIVTPEFEETGLFERGVGEATDIVRKEMYTFPDKGERLLTLRPEGTAPVCRAYVEHGLHKWPQPVKLWYHCPMFRYEKPQSGRYREHYQIGAEALGSADAAVDAEVIVMLDTVFKELAIGDLRLAVNSMGDPACRPAYVQLLRGYLRGRGEELCGDCRERLDLNPLRTFDCKVASCRAVLDEAPHIVDHLCGDCREHFDRVLDLLGRLGLEPHVDFRLVRGLDYYTRTTFEFSCDRLGAQSGVGGGGRYDGLVEQIGGPPTPGVGFGSGLERITLAMGVENDAEAGLDAYIVCFDEARRDDAFLLAERLRRELLLAIDLDLAGRSPKGQLKQAARLRAATAVMVGLSELPAGQVRVRRREGGDELDLSHDALVAWLAERIERGL